MNGLHSRALSNLTRLSIPRLPLTSPQCVSAAIETLTRSRSSHQGEQLHAIIVTCGLLPSPLLPSKLSAMYALCGNTCNARRLFDEIPLNLRARFHFNTLIRGHVQTSEYSDALQMFAEMLLSCCRPDNFTYPFVMKACRELMFVEVGRKIHGMAVVSGFGFEEHVANSLVSMYMGFGSTEAAWKVFDKMIHRNVVSWNSMIAGCCSKGYFQEALTIFYQTIDANIKVDPATIVSVLPACAALRDVEKGREIHELAKKMGFGTLITVRNALIDMYAKCGHLEEARMVFNEAFHERDVISWTTMIGGYVMNRLPSDAAVLAKDMLLSGVRPNPATIIVLLSICSGLPSIKRLDESLHGLCIKQGLESKLVVETALINTYASSGDIYMSSQVFSSSSRRTGTWNAIISGFTRNSQPNNAIKHFNLMLRQAVCPDLATIASVLPAYAGTADLQQTRNIHCYLIRTGFLESAELTTGIIDAYAKVGCLNTAWEIFAELPMKDIISWSAIIGGYGKHGHAKTAIRLFNQMVESGVEPNEVTFTAIIYSCSHSGLVDDGIKFFYRMIGERSIIPHVDHYACVVDLLCRAGRLQEAYKLIVQMPFKPNHAVWGALLGGCVIHENVEFGEVAAKHLIEIEPENTGNYVMLGNMYAAAGRWEDAEAVRRLLKRRGLSKAPGSTSVEIFNRIHLRR